MRADILAGSQFPDYELPDHTGRRRRLSEIQGRDPMIVVLSRGHFCPEGSPAARGPAAAAPGDGGRLLQAGHHQHGQADGAQRIQDRVSARTGRSLSDPERMIQKDLDIAEYTDPIHNPMIPHTIVLEPGLIVFKVYNGYWYFGRPTDRGAAAGPSRGAAQVPARLGHQRARSEDLPGSAATNRSSIPTARA